MPARGGAEVSNSSNRSKKRATYFVNRKKIVLGQNFNEVGLGSVAFAKELNKLNNEGLIGRARQDHRFGYRRASMFRRLQADLGLLLAALGAQQRHAPAGFSFLPPRPRRS